MSSRSMAAIAVLVVIEVAFAATPIATAGDADETLPPGTPTWQLPECEEDGSPLLATPYCTPPPGYRPQETPTPLTCDGAVFCNATYEEMAAAGYDVDVMQAQDREALQAATASLTGVGPTDELQKSTDPGLTPVPVVQPQAYYSAWVQFYLYHDSHCLGTKKQNNHCGWLYHKYTCSGNCPDDQTQGTVYTSSYPARSGNNKPADDWEFEVGPIPNEYSWRWGYMNGERTGYESDSGTSFDPGKWRLDPWSVTHNGKNRGAFEIHGGKGTSEFWKKGTKGCIRLPQASVTSLKSKYDNRTSNKTSVYVHIHY